MRLRILANFFNFYQVVIILSLTMVLLRVKHIMVEKWHTNVINTTRWLTVINKSVYSVVNGLNQLPTANVSFMKHMQRLGKF